ncbi:hypothetical protein ACWDWO_20805 [Actinopolymorpha singaporensis]
MIVVGVILVLVLIASAIGIAVGGGQPTAVELGPLRIESSTATFFFIGVGVTIAGAFGVWCLVVGTKRWRTRRRELKELRQRPADGAGTADGGGTAAGGGSTAGGQVGSGSGGTSQAAGGATAPRHAADAGTSPGSGESGAASSGPTEHGTRDHPTGEPGRPGSAGGPGNAGGPEDTGRRTDPGGHANRSVSPAGEPQHGVRQDPMP